MKVDAYYAPQNCGNPAINDIFIYKLAIIVKETFLLQT